MASVHRRLCARTQHLDPSHGQKNPPNREGVLVTERQKMVVSQVLPAKFKRKQIRHELSILATTISDVAVSEGRIAREA